MNSEKRDLLAPILKKYLWHASAGAAVWLLVRVFSPQGRVYAGWTAALLGACYLLAGWISWLRRRGTDFGALLRRRRPPETPYYLRGADKSVRPRLSLNGSRHTFDDDLAETADALGEAFDKDDIHVIRAVAWAAAGATLLLLSAF
ncbi:MAG: hypothetical protein IJU78_08405 [Clostridia bacterium]|nr:hypothetical protein [Clostridia bacterium]